ncbi:MAG: hypothetical protein SOW31_08495 [Treponema sp.]|nr:hypothetical protein [Treponema sp.]
MKKTLSIASLLAMILSVAIFTSCSEPEPYTGKFYNTEYVTNITDEEYKQNWENKEWETRSKHLATWPNKDGYEKKTNLKDYEVVSYLKSKMVITDEAIQNHLLFLETTPNSYADFVIKRSSDSNYNLLFLTKAE